MKKITYLALAVMTAAPTIQVHADTQVECPVGKIRVRIKVKRSAESIAHTAWDSICTTFHNIKDYIASTTVVSEMIEGIKELCGADSVIEIEEITQDADTATSDDTTMYIERYVTPDEFEELKKLVS